MDIKYLFLTSLNTGLVTGKFLISQRQGIITYLRNEGKGKHLIKIEQATYNIVMC